jgi:hypothetical protein
VRDKIAKAVAWTALCFIAYVIVVVLTQLGEPATAGAARFQLLSGRIIMVAAPLIWIASCARIFWKQGS